MSMRRTSSRGAAVCDNRDVADDDLTPREQAREEGAQLEPCPPEAVRYKGAEETLRRAKEDAIDHAVGVVCLVKRGDRVTAGDPLAEVHASDEDAAVRAVGEVAAAYRVGPDEPQPRPIVLEVLT